MISKFHYPMHSLFISAWQRFTSAVPPVVKKIQIILGLAAGTFTAAAAINWPLKIAFASTVCAYTASVCAGLVLALQFIEQTVTVFETKTEVKITTTETTTAREVPANG